MLFRSAINSPFAQKSQQVTFKKGDSIPAKAIAAKTEAGDGLVLNSCTSNITVNGSQPSQTLVYSGTSSQKNMIYVMCGDSIAQDEFIFPSGTSCTVNTVSGFACYVVVGPYTGS